MAVVSSPKSCSSNRKDSASVFSVVIPAFNEEFELPRTLLAFQEAVDCYRLQGGQREFEFVVVDNASTDRTAAIAEKWGARVIAEPHRQIARARNTGCFAATGGILITCDADSRPHRNVFVAIEQTLTPNVLAAGVRLRLPDLKWRYRLGYYLVNLVSFFGRLPAGMFILRRADFYELGGFNEQLYALEDVEFSRRLRARARLLGQKTVILWNCPIETSSRKFRRLSPFQILHSLLNYLLHPRTSLRNRRNRRSPNYGENLRDTLQ
jgi:glycosyltransferase involved in cell wall biosynthesis